MADRIAYLNTPLGINTLTGLQFAQLHGFDAVNECFRFEVYAQSQSPNIPALDLLGQECSVEAHTDETAPGQVRHFSGIVDQFRFDGNDEEGLFRYRLILRPNLWMLSKASDNRIFQEMSVPEIVTTILDENGFSNYELRLQNSYAPRTYCVQFGETTLDFIQRLLEHEGILYFHEFADLSHTLILLDSADQLDPQPVNETLRFEPDGAANLRGGGVVTRWEALATVVTGTHTQTDYDFEKPSADLMTQFAGAKGHANDAMERYDYPGNYLTTGDGDPLTTLRLHEDQGAHYDIAVDSTASLPWAGNIFDLIDYPRESENGSYIILRAQYELWDDQYYAGHGTSDISGFTARYRVVPFDSEWRPPRLTPRPVMKGPQTAVVVGPAGEEIYTDQYSRVKVQFHWDRVGGKDENSSCWVRVSAAWAGSGWGFIQIPRIGQEVIVDFLEGDPDQPIITGRVYNAEQMPPYELPANATQSGWKSNSSKGGGGWNELMFEDKKGSELVYFQAEKDHDELVKNNETRHIGNDWVEDVVHDATQWVGHNRDETVDNCKTTHVKVDRTVNIDHDDTETVGNMRSLTVGVNETITVGSNSDETIGVNHSQTVGANQTVTVGLSRVDTVGVAETRTVGAAQVNTIGATRQVSVGISQSHDVGATDSWEIGGGQSVEIAKDQGIKIGKNHSQGVGEDSAYQIGKNLAFTIGENTDLETGKELSIKAVDSITLVCGKAKFQMKKDGTIVLEGKDISVKGSGKIVAKASGVMTLKGSKINQN